MKNFNKSILLLMSLLMVMTLCACRDKQTEGKDGETEVINQVDNVKDIVTNNEKLDICEISTDKLLNTFNEISDIKENFDISTSKYKTLSLDDFSNYTMNNQFIVRCEPLDNQNLVGDDFKISSIINYKGNNEYPSTISITCEYINESDREKAEVWTNKVFNSLTNQIVADTLSKTAYNTRDAEAYTVDELRVTVSKTVEDFTDSTGKYVSTYAMNVVDTRKLNDEVITAELDDFNPSGNANYILFNTPVIAYSEKLSNSTYKIGRFFNDTATANLTEIKDIHNEADGNEYNKAYVNYSISSRQNGDTFFTLEAVKNVKGDRVTQTISVNTKTLDYETKLDCFYAAEDLIKNIVGKDVELEKYFDSDTFSINVDKDSSAYEFGYPAKLDCKVNNESDKYSISININTLEEVENATENTGDNS